eukprot:scaffold706514_cov75-Attheya_sp.AAC.2
MQQDSGPTSRARGDPCAFRASQPWGSDQPSMARLMALDGAAGASIITSRPTIPTQHALYSVVSGCLV